jgi:hypothetical protein
MSLEYKHIFDVRRREPVRGVWNTNYISALQKASQEFKGVSVNIVANPGEEYTTREGHTCRLAVDNAYIQIDGLCDKKTGLTPLYDRAKEILAEVK